MMLKFPAIFYPLVLFFHLDIILFIDASSILVCIFVIFSRMAITSNTQIFKTVNALIAVMYFKQKVQNMPKILMTTSLSHRQ